MKNQITYVRIAGKGGQPDHIRVCLAGMYVGDIKNVHYMSTNSKLINRKGFQYFTRNSPMKGQVFDTVKEVKDDLEDDDGN